MKHGTFGTRVVPFTLALLAAAGCGGDSGGEPGGAAAVVESPVDAATAGHVSATVTFSGTPPSLAQVDMGNETTCIDKHASLPLEPSFVSGSGGGLGNVFVYVREGLEDLQFPTPSSAVVLDQDGCVYMPHVLGVQAGQTLTIRNSDGILHNVNASPTVNRPFNVSQPVNMDTNRTFPAPEVMIPVRCDVHGWMRAYIGVLPHPYHAVSSQDGAAALQGLPPGDYVVEAWHERFGTLTQNVTVSTGETAAISFEFTDAMAGAHVPLGEPIDLLHPDGHAAGDHR